MTKILVGLSGGVDSAVSAYLLKKEGHEVSCGFMINYLDEENPGNCPTKADLEEARRVAEYLELPFYTFDYREEYEKRIVEYIYREYEAGRTPNPDVFCNNLVKFDIFLEEALALGFSGIATGHYARIMKNSKLKIQNIGTDNLESGILNLELYKGVDPNKDQSYFLSRLSPFQISKAYFPIGHLLKSEVREIAKAVGLPNADRKDSQGLCFIGKVSMKEFLERRIDKKPGNILDTNGKVVGTHEGAFSYTIGQRRGIQVGGGPALFVIGKNIKENTITVGTEAELSLFSKNCTLSDWVGHLPEEGRIYGAKIRYRQEDQKCQITMNNEQGTMNIVFEQNQRAITSGQICVIYDGEIVVGSGIIQ
ncbi:MAG: tRNA 2-thiouridine(34) synthase MnmA [Candidatus Gracilibacteria bacterium]|nr:tRNA 2-thiouridine(34) synthase MnmA [Candidatus Gracilibacteria bacterium]